MQKRIVQLIFARFLKVKDAWKQVDPANALFGRSTVLQPAEDQARGVIASHLGWLEKDAGRKINTIARCLGKRILNTYKGAQESQRRELENLDRLIHELRAINAAHAWNWPEERQLAETVMKVDGVLKTASRRSYECSEKVFKMIEKRRSFPDLSCCQIEATRGGAKLFGSEGVMPASALAPLGISLEKSQSNGSSFGHWVRLTVADPSLDPMAATGAESILIPTKAHKPISP